MKILTLGGLAAAAALALVACGGEEFAGSNAAEGAGGGATGGAGGASGAGQQGGSGASGTAGSAGSSAGTAGAAGSAGAGGEGGAAGQAGAAGESGSGGSAGSSGAAGEGGNAGVAGMAGSAGEGGAAGEAGQAGMAGQAGAAGEGGMGGAAGSAGAAGEGGAAGQAGSGGASGSAGSGGVSGSAGSGGVSGGAGAGGAVCAQQCLPLPPPDWLGYGVVDQKPALGCGVDYPESLMLYRDNDLDGGDSSCECTCGGASGIGCRTTLTTGATACFAAATDTAVGSSCTPVPGMALNITEGVKASGVEAHGGSCPPQSSGTIGKASWPVFGRACLRSAGGDCAGGGWCPPQLPAGAHACIARVGAASCPQGYPVKLSFYDGKYKDDRACGGSCTCDAPTGASCSCGSACGVDVFASNDCGGSVLMTVKPGGDCLTQHWATDTASARLFGATASGGSCSPSGSAQVVGSLSPTGPITVCCAQ